MDAGRGSCLLLVVSEVSRVSRSSRLSRLLPKLAFFIGDGTGTHASHSR